MISDHFYGLSLPKWTRNGFSVRLPEQHAAPLEAFIAN